VPLLPEGNVIHETLLAALQDTPEAIVTDVCSGPPPPSTLRSVGERTGDCPQRLAPNERTAIKDKSRGIFPVPGAPEPVLRLNRIVMEFLRGSLCFDSSPKLSVSADSIEAKGVRLARAGWLNKSGRIPLCGQGDV